MSQYPDAFDTFDHPVDRATYNAQVGNRWTLENVLYVLEELERIVGGTPQDSPSTQAIRIAVLENTVAGLTKDLISLMVRVAALEALINQSVKTDASPTFVNPNATGVYKVDSVQVVGNQDGGWAPFTGSADKDSSFDTSSATLGEVAARLKAIQDVMATHGLIGEV